MVFKVADLFVVLYNSIVANPATGHGREGVNFGENGSWIIRNQQNLQKRNLTSIFGAAQRPLAQSPVLSIGWKPVKTTKDFLVGIKPEVLTMVKKSEQEA